MYSCYSTETRHVFVLEVQDDLFISCDSNCVYMLGNTKAEEQRVSFGEGATDFPSPSPATRKKTLSTERSELKWTYFPWNDSLPWNHGKKLPVALIIFPRVTRKCSGRLGEIFHEKAWGPACLGPCSSRSWWTSSIRILGHFWKCRISAPTLDL